MRKILIFLLGAIVICFLSCRESEVEGATLTKLAYGKEVLISLNSKFQIRLPGNASTGCAWNTVFADAGIIMQKGEPDYQESSGGIGKSGFFVLTYEAIGTGTSKLRLNYGRSWEPQSPIDSFFVTILVK
jgi:predicted secreted protein